MGRLLACRFCRQIFRLGETDGACPDCGVRLEPLDKLPPSLDAAAEDEPAEPVPVDDQALPWTDLGRGRGVLGLLALLGIVAFFLPWIELRVPVQDIWSGYELARHRLGWVWGGAVGWFVTLPLAMSRRTVHQMRGVRVILCVFAAMTLVEVAVLVGFPPSSDRWVTVDFNWGVGLYLSALASVAGLLVASRFGGSIGDSTGSPPSGASLESKSSRGKTLH
jgi:hypothetical protein